jgi:pectin methylesterase-like acyl-CoA thioesterase
LNGVTSDIQTQIDNIAALVAPENTIQVSPNGAYTSIAAAVDSITDSSPTNRYVVRAGPGNYTEPLIEIPSWVYVVGDHSRLASLIYFVSLN